ncbi:hypothetical protein [Pseudomonas plecoglossicida]|uniref:hypothetical protein n=1 Tax=Pseudomonas plecoglossicida TaxID=70775 RepID=UPI00051CD84E|nr:hypothetical protein [Pseudomonas plecoglossicida]KGK24417.1 hypothetical protein GT93_05970 [Pseudomonas plecoglossicida]
MSAITSELSELQSLLCGTASAANIEKAKIILNRLQQISQKQPASTTATASGPGVNRNDPQYMSILEKLHETQEELLACTMQNTLLLNSLSECYDAMEKSASITEKLIQANKR